MISSVQFLYALFAYEDPFDGTVSSTMRIMDFYVAERCARMVNSAKHVVCLTQADGDEYEIAKLKLLNDPRFAPDESRTAIRGIYKFTTDTYSGYYLLHDDVINRDTSGAEQEFRLDEVRRLMEF